MKMYLMAFLVVLGPLAHAEVFTGTAAKTSRLCTALRSAVEDSWHGRLTTPAGKKIYMRTAFLPWNGHLAMTTSRGSNLIEEIVTITNDSYTPTYGAARESCRLQWKGVDVKLTRWKNEIMNTDMPNSNSDLKTFANKLTFEGEVYGEYGTLEFARE